MKARLMTVKTRYFKRQRTMARQLTQRLITNLLLKPQLQPQALNPALPLYMNGYSPFEFVAQSRMLCKHVDIVDHTCKVSNYAEFIQNYKPVQRILKDTLQEILGVTRLEINKIVEENPQLKKRVRANILNNYYNLLEAGVKKGTIKNNVWLLAHKNNKLMDKLECIKVLNMDSDQLVPWLCLTQEKLSNYVLYTKQDMDSHTYNRLEYLSYKLECSVQKSCEVTLLNSFLVKIPVSSIDKKLNILYEYNVSNKDILKNVWVLRYSESHIHHKCKLYKNTGMLKIKTSAERYPLKVTSRAIKKNKVEHSLMQQYETVSEYLQNKLKVNDETLNSVVQKIPRILRVNIVKLDQLIDILHQNGITSDEILRHTQIFYFNIDTIQNRIRILRKEGLIPNLIILTKAERIFDQQIEIKSEQRKLLQKHGSVKNYLLNKLNIDEKILDYLITKYPSISRIKFKKLIEVIDTLQQNGITNDDIMNNPGIFHFATKTLRKRIEILKEGGIPLKLKLLCSGKSVERYTKLRSHNSKKT